MAKMKHKTKNRNAVYSLQGQGEAPSFVLQMYNKENCESVSRQQLTLQPSEHNPFGNVKGKFSATVRAERTPEIFL